MSQDPIPANQPPDATQGVYSNNKNPFCLVSQTKSNQLESHRMYSLILRHNLKHVQGVHNNPPPKPRLNFWTNI